MVALPTPDAPPGLLLLSDSFVAHTHTRSLANTKFTTIAHELIIRILRSRETFHDTPDYY